MSGRSNEDVPIGHLKPAVFLAGRVKDPKAVENRKIVRELGSGPGFRTGFFGLLVCCCCLSSFVLVFWLFV